MDWAGWALFGLVATAALTVVMVGAQLAGLTRLDLPLLLGTTVTADPDRARVAGFFIHLAIGLGFALGYAAGFALLDEATWWLGGLFGLLHVAVALTVLVPPSNAGPATPTASPSGSATAPLISISSTGTAGSSTRRGCSPMPDITCYSETWRTMRGFADEVTKRWTMPDAGIWEIRGDGAHHVHSKLMAWLALDRALRIAETHRTPARQHAPLGDRARGHRRRGHRTGLRP